MNTSKACPLPSRLSVFAATAVLVIGAGLPTEAPRAAVRNAEDLLIVDCLLPGQIRSLGRVATFMSARRPIRTNQADSTPCSDPQPAGDGSPIGRIPAIRTLNDSYYLL